MGAAAPGENLVALGYDGNPVPREHFMSWAQVREMVGSDVNLVHRLSKNAFDALLKSLQFGEAGE